MDPIETIAVEAVEIEIIEERPPDAYGFTLKTRANGLLHRILPLRDPRQPRFWCVVVYRCSSGGLPDPNERPWIGPGGLKREDLRETMGAIRADPTAWLADAAHGPLREWILAAGTEPVLPMKRTAAKPSPSLAASE
jgi:hypothetical protein